MKKRPAASTFVAASSAASTPVAQASSLRSAPLRSVAQALVEVSDQESEDTSDSPALGGAWIGFDSLAEHATNQMKDWIPDSPDVE